MSARATTIRAPRGAGRGLATLLSACALALVAMTLGTSTAQASFPGVNGRIAFTRCVNGAQCDQWELWTMNPDGSDQSRLLSDPGYADDDPDVSADGRQIAFQRCHEGVGVKSCGIAVVDAHGQGLRQLTPAYTNGDDYPAFSPDGSLIVFDRWGPNKDDIWVMRADGSNAHALIAGPDYESRPEFSPDGSKIVFQRRVGGVYHIWLMNADGSNPRALTGAPNRDDQQPTFSPDGSQVAFQGCPAGANCAIWVAGVDGAGAHQVTSPSPNDADWEPAFSPDGSRLVFERWFDAIDMSRLFSQPLAGGGATQLTSAYDWAAAWGRVPTPSIDSVPTIAGTARAGHVLTAAAGAAGWGGSASFQWIRCTSTCNAIAGATAATYRPTNADVGATLKLRQTQTSAGGSVSADSPAVGPVAAAPGARIVGKLSPTRAGRLVARLSCPAEQSVVCRGKLTLTVSAHKHTAGAGSAVFEIAAGRSAKVTVRLSKRAKALLAKSRTPRLRAALVTRDDAGNTTVTRSAVALRKHR